MRFSEVIGQEGIIAHLVRGADAGRVSHAQLFAGRSGAGILPLAWAYVQYLNCTDRRDGDSCGACPNCLQTAALAHPDLHFVFPVNKQGKKSGEVVLSDDFMPPFRQAITESGGYLTPAAWYEKLDLGKTLKGVIAAKETDAIIKKLSFKSFAGQYKCVVIWLPETMNEEAGNKLLKVLEEPWERTVFVLVSERPEMLLATIRSRVQQIDIPGIEPEAIRAEIEKKETDPGKVTVFTRLAAGDVVEMRGLLAGEDADEVRKEYFDLFARLMRLSYNDKHLELIGWAEEVAAMPRESQRAFLRDILRLTRESYIIHAGVGEIGMLWGEEAKFCKNFAPFIDNTNIEPIIDQVETASAQIYQNGNPTIIFTHFALAVSKMIKKK